jgi:predicted ArsR family transcriptional regulator
MRWWETSIGGAVRGKIIALLRRGERSVEDLASELGVTDNAVRAQLQALERHGVVHQARVRREGTVGKPAVMYAIAPSAEAMFSSAYAPVLKALIASLENRLDGSALDEIFRETGRRLANELTNDEAGAPKQLETRARSAAAVLSALGAEIDVERMSGGSGFLLRGHACPLSDAVTAQPKVCHAIQELVAGISGATVHECCDRDGHAKCRFEVRRTA